MKLTDTWGYPIKLNFLFVQFWVKKFISSLSEYLIQNKLFFHLLLSRKRSNLDFDHLVNYNIIFICFFPGGNNAFNCFSKYFGKNCPDNSLHIIFSSPQHADIFSYHNGEFVCLMEGITSNNFYGKKNVFLQYMIIFLPLFDDNKKFLLFNLFFRFLFTKISKCAIYYPKEGHSWEKSLNFVSKNSKNIKTYGFLHALNITCPTNARLKYSKTFSPDYAIAQCSESRNILLNHGWPKHKTYIRSIDRKSPLDNISIKRSTEDIKSVLLIGSFKKVEDIAVLEFLSVNYSSDCYKIFYKAHPLIIPFLSSHSKKLNIPKNLEICNVIEDSYDTVFSPLSSTSSIQLLKNSSNNIFFFLNPKYFCPNPLLQFNVNIDIVSFSDNYSIYTIDKTSFTMPSIFSNQDKIPLFL